jgi:hypothetical protein
MLGEGQTIPEAAMGLSKQTYHRWHNRCGGMKADDAKRLKDFECENSRARCGDFRCGGHGGVSPC